MNAPDPQVFLEAAEIIETEKERFSCLAIAHVTKNYKNYSPVNNPTEQYYIAWGVDDERWPDYAGVRRLRITTFESDASSAACRAHRVLALCMAATLAENKELPE